MGVSDRVEKLHHDSQHLPTFVLGNPAVDEIRILLVVFNLSPDSEEFSRVECSESFLMVREMLVSVSKIFSVFRYWPGYVYEKVQMLILCEKGENIRGIQP